jgi:hypothetical protein
VAQIEHAGVQLRSRGALHRFFRPFAGQSRQVHVHVRQAGSGWEREHLFVPQLSAQPARCQGPSVLYGFRSVSSWRRSPLILHRRHITVYHWRTIQKSWLEIQANRVRADEVIE